MSTGRQFSLEGKIALVLGGSGKIGQEIALGFAEAGACAVVVGKTKDKVDKTAAALRKFNVASEGLCGDLTKQEELRQIIDLTLGQHDRIDILVNAQGATVRCPSEHLSREAFDEAISLNLTTVTFACTEVGREMIARGSGAII